MAVASIVPGVGCSIVWVPAGIILILLGETIKGSRRPSGRAIVISGADNLLRPTLLTHDVEMHPLVIFLGLFGGDRAIWPDGIRLGADHRGSLFGPS